MLRESDKSAQSDSYLWLYRTHGSGYCAVRFANTSRGAKASSIIYSVVETAKENGLNPFQYLKYLFEQLPQLDDPKDPQALDVLLPWSLKIPLTCRMFKAD